MTPRLLSLLPPRLIKFSPDGKLLAYQCKKNIKLWDVTKKREHLVFNCNYSFLAMIPNDFSPDGQILAAFSNENTVKLWDVNTGQEIKTFSGCNSEYIKNGSPQISDIKFSHDGKILGINNTGGCKLYAIDTGKEIMTQKDYEDYEDAPLAGLCDPLATICFSPDRKILASIEKNAVRLYDIATAKNISTICSDFTENAIDINFSPDGKILAILCYSGENVVSFWDINTSQKLWSLREGFLLRFRLNFGFSPDGKTFAYPVERSSLKLFNANTGEEIRTLINSFFKIDNVDFSHDWKKLAYSIGNTIKVRDLDTEQEFRIRENDKNIIDICFSPDGKTLAYMDEDEKIRILDVTRREESRKLTGHESAVNSICFSPDGKILASSSSDSTIKLWNIETDKEIHTLYGHQSKSIVMSISFSPDGKTLASGGTDKTIKIWNVKTGKEIQTLSGHKGPVYSVSFSPDGNTLASSSSDKTIRIWDMTIGKELRTINGHIDTVNSVSFSPTGEIVASGSVDKTITLSSLDFDFSSDVKN